MKKYLFLFILFILIHCTIFAQQSSSPGLYVVKQNNKYGYIDSTGKIIIQPQFDFSDDFVGGKARVLINGNTPIEFKYGLIDKKGNYILKPNYDYMRIQPNGFILAKQDSVWFVMDSTAKEVGKFKTPFVFFANENIAIINKGEIYPNNLELLKIIKDSEGTICYENNKSLQEAWVIYSKNGKEIYSNIIELPHYYNYSKNYIIFLDTTLNKYGAIDLNGKILKPKYDILHSLSNNLLVFGDKNGIGYYKIRLGIVDFSGKVILPPSYGMIGDESGWGLSDPISEGLIRVQKIGNNNPLGFAGHGFINTKGKLVIDTIYGSSTSFHEGLAAVQQNFKWGYINKSGKIVIPFAYEDAGHFEDGRAIVSIHVEDRSEKSPWVTYGVIDKSGNYLIKPNYSGIWYYKEGVFKTIQYNSLSNIVYEYYDLAGKLIAIDSIGNANLEILRNESRLQHTLSWLNNQEQEKKWPHFKIQDNLIKYEKKIDQYLIIDNKLNTICSKTSDSIDYNTLFLGNIISSSLGLLKLNPQNCNITLVDTTIILSPFFYSQGLLLAADAKNDKQVFFVDSNGNKSKPLPNVQGYIAPAYYQPYFSEGYLGLPLSKDSSLYLNKEGDIVTKLPYAEVGHFNNGFTYCKKYISGEKYGEKYKYAILNKQFKTITPFEYDAIGDFSNGLASFKDSTGRYGFINTSGEIVIDPQFKQVSKFKHGNVIVTNADGFGVINDKGEWVLKLQKEYFLLKLLSDSLILVQKGDGKPHYSPNQKYSKFGAINLSGQLIIPLEYDFISSFNKGSAIGGQDKGEYQLCSLINTKGDITKQVFLNDFSRMNILYEMTFQRELNNKYTIAKPIDSKHIEIGYYNSSGKCIWPVQY